MSQHISTDDALAHAIIVRGVRQYVPLPLRTYTTHMLGGNNVDTRKYEDGPDAIPVGTARTLEPDLTGVHLTDDTQVLDLIRGAELYRVRVHSDLYDDWQVTMTVDLAHAEARGKGLLVADCHACHTTQMVAPDAIACPICRTAY